MWSIEIPEKEIAPGLYICATPIGNLEDITLRVLYTLNVVDAIYAEDTRNAIKLLNRYQIKKPLISCHEHNERMRAEEIVSRVLEGDRIAYISDAGMPGISDPGGKLIEACIAANAPFTVLPGACAAITAHVLANLNDSFRFEGFLPRDAADRRKHINALRFEECCIVLYESPVRVSATLKDIYTAFGDRNAALVREITKLHETVVRGTLSELIARFDSEPLKGECVLVIDGAKEIEKPDATDVEGAIRRLLDLGYSAKDAAKEAARTLEIPKNDAYRIAVSIIGQR